MTSLGVFVEKGLLGFIEVSLAGTAVGLQNSEALSEAGVHAP